jgi:hypothetical protein
LYIIEETGQFAIHNSLAVSCVQVDRGSLNLQRYVIEKFVQIQKLKNAENIAEGIKTAIIAHQYISRDFTREISLRKKNMNDNFTKYTAIHANTVEALYHLK